MSATESRVTRTSRTGGRTGAGGHTLHSTVQGTGLQSTTQLALGTTPSTLAQ